MNKKSNVILVVIGLMLASYYVAAGILKISYSQKDVFTIDGLKVNDSITVNSAYMVLGKNYKGFIEATIFPAVEQRFKGRGIVEYYYLRFHPDWFKKNVFPVVTGNLNGRRKLSFELVEKAKTAHRDNFQHCCHFNDYPIVNEGLLFARISLLGVADKITMFTDTAD